MENSRDKVMKGMFDDYTTKKKSKESIDLLMVSKVGGYNKI